MKHYLLSFILLLFYAVAAAQTNFAIEDYFAAEITDCSGTTVSADAYNGVNTYSINLSFAVSGNITAVVNPVYFDQIWDIDSNSMVRIYNGFDDTTELLGSYNTAKYPNDCY